MELFKGKTQHRRAFKLVLIGFSLISISYLVYAFDPLNLIVDHLLAVREGTFLFNIFKKPPLEMFISVYVFNITNLDRFLGGLDKKIRVEEVGPYVYQEFLENRNTTFNENDTLTYRPVRRVEFIPEKSIGDPKEHFVTIPNVPYMGVTTAASKLNIFAAMGIRTLMRTLDAEVALNVSVHDYLWGYDDPLVRLASTVIPGVIHFEKFGLLDRMFDEGDNVVVVNLPKLSRENTTESVDDLVHNKDDHLDDIVNSFLPDLPFSIKKLTEEQNSFTPKIRDYSMNTYNGETRITYWGDKTTQCNALIGAYDGTLFPRNITKNETFRLYRKPFCRTLPIVYSHPGTVDGVDAYFFKLSENAFDSSLNDSLSSCYCTETSCLRKGLGNITPCYYNIPAAVSFPHFFNADPSLIEEVDGLSPSEQKHGSEVVLQPQLGVPMKVHVRLQINLLMEKISFNQKLKPFANTVLPLLWVEISLESLTPQILFMLKMLFNVAPYLQAGAIYVFALLGISMFSMSALVFFCVPDHSQNFNPKKDVRYSAIYMFPYIRKEFEKQSSDEALITTEVIETGMLLEENA